MADTDNTSNQAGKGSFKKSFVQKVPGLYIAIDPSNDNGQTYVVRQDKNDSNMYPVWNSIWNRTLDTIRMPTDQPLLTTDDPHNVLAIPTKLKQTVSVHHSPPGGQQTPIYTHPTESVDQQTPQYMRTLRAADVSKEDLAKLIPPSTPESGKNEDVRRNKLGLMVDSASDHDGGDDQDEGRAFIDLSGPVDTSGVSPGDSSNVPFLYVYEHHTCNPKLTFGPQSTLRLIREKKKSNDLVLCLKEVDGNAPVHVEYYRFKQGYTLRFNDCFSHSGPATVVDLPKIKREPPDEKHNHPPTHADGSQKSKRAKPRDATNKKPQSPVYGCLGNGGKCQERYYRYWRSKKEFRTHFETHLEDYETPEGFKCPACEKRRLSPGIVSITTTSFSHGRDLAMHVWFEHMVPSTTSKQPQDTSLVAKGEPREGSTARQDQSRDPKLENHFQNTIETEEDCDEPWECPDTQHGQPGVSELKLWAVNDSTNSADAASRT